MPLQDQIDRSYKRETYYKWQVKNEVAMGQNAASCSFIKPAIVLMIQICLSRAMNPEMRATKLLVAGNISRDMLGTIWGVAMEMKQGENREK